DFISNARSTPAAASATSGGGNISCLKRRLRMILRSKTPKGLSWAGRFALMAAAAVLLPLAPSWAQNDDSPPPPIAPDQTVTFLASSTGGGLAPVQEPDQPATEAKRGEFLETLVDQLKDFIQQGLSGVDSDKDEQLENRISKKLMEDSDVVALGR